jgi:2-dehydro-3-deoxyphosphogluconate aldolase / (4S)-4-hydroxy-2-oxoglutarate aldolase
MSRRNEKGGATVKTMITEAAVLPVLTVAGADVAVALSRALATGGIRAVEITLRTEAALGAIQAVKRALPELIVAAGTVTTVDQMVAVSDAGADFAVSPGMTEALIGKATSLSLPFLPGVATPSEVLRGRELGLDCFKLFPAVAVGGLSLLKSLADPLADVSFCPTGGLTQENFTDFLALPNVVCVGGSWMADRQMIAEHNWDGIAELARQTVARASAAAAVKLSLLLTGNGVN